MKRSVLVLFLWLTLAHVVPTSADDTLDTLLPPPFWFRSHAEELKIDPPTRERIEAAYQSLEPKYHQLKAQVEQRTKHLYEALVADELDEQTIVERMQALLEAENELKLHQVHVRISLLSMVSAEQRRQARELAKRNPEPNFKKVLADKVERIRQLAARVNAGGGSVAEAQRQLQEAEKTIAEGSVIEGARMLDRIIRSLESELDLPSDRSPGS